jgi:hypothetical protein
MLAIILYLLSTGLVLKVPFFLHKSIPTMTLQGQYTAEPVLVYVKGARESIPGNRFGQPM